MTTGHLSAAPVSEMALIVVTQNGSGRSGSGIECKSTVIAARLSNRIPDVDSLDLIAT